MNNKQRVEEVDQLIVRIRKINNIHHNNLDGLLQSMKKDDICNLELQHVIKELRNVTEEYVVDITELVSGIKKASLKYFRRVITKFDI